MHQISNFLFIEDRLPWLLLILFCVMAYLAILSWDMGRNYGERSMIKSFEKEVRDLNDQQKVDAVDKLQYIASMQPNLSARTDEILNAINKIGSESMPLTHAVAISAGLNNIYDTIKQRFAQLDEKVKGIPDAIAFAELQKKMASKIREPNIRPIIKPKTRKRQKSMA